MGWGRDYNGNNINFQCLPVSSSFLKVMGIEVKDGRDFRPEDDQKETGCYIFNEKAKAQYELKLNEKIDGDEIIGFYPGYQVRLIPPGSYPDGFLSLGQIPVGAGRQLL